MAESIGTRVGRIIAGSVHALIDAVENAAPEMVMEQAIREVDEVIADVRAELGRAAANKHLASTRLMEENRKHEELTAQIELAVGQSRDDLASAAIARQLDIEAQIPVLESTIVDCQGREKELEGYIAALQAKKREMQEAVRQFTASRAQAQAPGAPHPAASSSTARVERAESAFDRVLQKQAGVSGLSPVPDRATATKLAELNDMARTNRIQERLAAVKAKAPK
jgi:phage shock protein A